MTTAAKLDLLAQAHRAMLAGEPLPPAARAWLAPALGHYIRAGGDLNRLLGLRPRRGGQHETPHALLRRQRLHRLLGELSASLPGDVPPAQAIAAMLGGAPVPPEAAVVFAALHALDPPRSEDRLRRILRQVAAQRSGEALNRIFDLLHGVQQSAPPKGGAPDGYPEPELAVPVPAAPKLGRCADRSAEHAACDPGNAPAAP